MNRLLFLLLPFLLPCMLFSQNVPKKVLGHEELISWKKIRNVSISTDGKWVSYRLVPDEGDPSMVLINTKTQAEKTFPRVKKGGFTYDASHLVFLTSPPQDSLKALKRKKTKKDDLPKDTLYVLNLENQTSTTVANVSSFDIPEKWSGSIAYIPDWELPKQDSTSKEKLAKENEKNGKRIVVHQLASGKEDTIWYVTEHAFAEKQAQMAFITSGKGKEYEQGVYTYGLAGMEAAPLFQQAGKQKQLGIHEEGEMITFLADTDTSDHLVPNWKLMMAEGSDPAQEVLADLSFAPEQWSINEHMKPFFSENGKTLFFGTSPAPMIEDTTLLPEEKPGVEVWHYQDPLLYTQQKVRAKEEKKRSYLASYDIASGKSLQLGGSDIPEVRLAEDNTASYAAGYSPLPYLQEISWSADRKNDVYAISLTNGARIQVATAVNGRPLLSPAGKYMYWYDRNDSSWYAYTFRSEKLHKLTSPEKVPVYDEQNDRPMLAGSYGPAGWIEEDAALLVYDRYDIWKLDPENQLAPVNLTKGRADQLTYRYIDLDEEEESIPASGSILLHRKNNINMAEGYVAMNWKKQKLTTLIEGEEQFSGRIYKAAEADELVYTRASFRKFPNLLLSDERFSTSTQISDANPQQADYLWGDISLYEWTSLDGKPLRGLLLKPENFDPNKKYPMIVNFYEKSSGGLHRHRAPEAHRSTINYSFYASRGYVIFNPDVPYRDGYPGESAYNAVIAGVSSLINEGFIDKDRVGVQGHSWGGYQIAYLVTKTDMFACAEAGAPVVNMISAYGGIRWQTGLSRMFQYEQTQSRIGGTLWEYPMRYWENSPIFFTDKINTPVLIMHNDADGHVPWYQGIEFFVSMRRLGKPAWMLNYNDEPHWPLKLQNRKDFNIRMQQFFDYYLKGAPIPSWMERGVPAVEQGISTGYEYSSESE
ncbi:MAG: prolyl oligopeptidase family serine peptidase [Bacteroidota bacterium]